jgi:hypothetical protein
VVTVDQHFLTNDSTSLDGFTIDAHNVSNEVKATDTLSVSAAGVFSGPTDTKTTQTYTENSAYGDCYSRTLTAVQNVLTNVTNGQGCPAHHHF